MPKPSSKTPAKLEQMFALHREGASAREIGEALGLNHNTVIHWLDDAGLATNGGYGSRKTRRRIHPDAIAAATSAARTALAKLSLVPSPVAGDALSTLREHKAIARGLLEFHFDRAKQGETAVAEIARAMSLEKDLIIQIEEMTPREPVDPEVDPTNLEAAAEVRAKLLRLVEAAERSFFCESCGQSAYAKKGGT